MSESRSCADDSLSLAAMLRIEQACFRFEEAWRAGQRPHIEDFTNGVAGTELIELLTELLRLELHYLRRQGQEPDQAVYEARLPEHVALVRTLFAELPEMMGSTVSRLDSGHGNALVGTGAHASTRLPARTGSTMGDPNRTLAYQDPAPEQAKPRRDRKRWLPTVPGYEILSELGRGGMGVVFKARHRTLKRMTAVKMILSGEYATPAELARFRTEATSIASVKHPNIVQIFEIGEAQGRLFLALEYAEGGRLDHRTRGTPQPPRVATNLVAILARAAHVAHLRGVIHRDIKPSNVLLSLKDEAPPAVGGEVTEPPLEAFDPKLADFGLAFCLGAEGDSGKTGDVMGTPSYMSPEQAEGRLKAIGPQTDVYGLAAILYELLTGRPPFKGTTRAETIDQVRTREPVPLLELQPNVPRDLEIICLKGLRKESAKRYATAQELADDLQRWLDGRPIMARPVPVWERAAKWVRRRPALATAVAAGLLAVLGLTTGAVCYGLYEHQQMRAQQDHVARVQEVGKQLGEGRAAEGLNQWNEAQSHYSKALHIIDSDPSAADEWTRQQVVAGDARIRQQLAAQVIRNDFAERRKKFGPHRYELFFQALKFRPEDAADHGEIVRREAAVAIEAFGAHPDDPGTFGSAFEGYCGIVDADDLVVAATEFVEVLLTWADAERALPAGAERARTVLAAANDLIRRHGLPAPCVEQFEAAQKSYRAGDWAKALPLCEEALRLQPRTIFRRPGYLKVLCHMRAAAGAMGRGAGC